MMDAMRRARTVFSTLAIVVGLAVCLAACQSAAGNTARVYVSLPLRGPKIGGSIERGVELAFDEISSQVGDKRIELVILDNGDANGQWSADVEKANAGQAVADPQAVAYIGPMNSGAARVSIPVTNRAGLLQISPSTTWPGLTKPGYAQGEPGIFYPTGQRTFFRTVPTDDAQGPAAALWAKSLGYKSFFTLDDGETYGAGVATLFARRAEQVGLKNLGHRTIDKKAEDYQAVLAEVKQANPELVYFGGTVANGAARLLKQMRSMGIHAAFMGPDGIVDTSLIDMAGPAAEGVYATFVGIPASQLTTERGKQFYSAYQAHFHEAPEAYAQNGYDAGLAVIEAIRQAQVVDRNGVLSGMRAVPSFDGTGGRFVFDATGDTSLRQVSGNVVKNGAFQFVEALTAPH